MAPEQVGTREAVAPFSKRWADLGGSRYGLVVGVEAYADARLNLRCARADARVIYELMVDPDCGFFPPENVQLLLDQDATTNNVWAALASLRRRVGPADTVWVYFAGHAALQEDHAYWVTHDADIDDLYASALGGDRISDAIHRFQAPRVLLMLDCCHAAATTLQKNPTRTLVVESDLCRQFTGQGVVTLASSNRDQKSVELSELGHGAFTYFLHRGLRGEADLNNDGVVTAEELWFYLRGNVERASRGAGQSQTPVLIGSITHDMLLTRHTRSSAWRERLLKWLELNADAKEVQLTPNEVNFCTQLLLRECQTGPEETLLTMLNEAASGRLLPAHLATFLRVSFPQYAELRPAQLDELRRRVQSDADECAGYKSRGKDVGEYLECACEANLATWQQAAGLGMAAGQWLVALCRMAGIGLAIEPAAALSLCLAAATGGDARAQGTLGEWHQNGCGVPPDNALARQWFRAAAAQGYANAQYELGLRYLNELDADVGPTRGFYWLRQAAEQGHAVAQYNVACCYRDARGVEQNAAEALRWFQAAATQGNPNAQHALALCHQNASLGVSQDPERAVHWFRLAAAQGHVFAQNCLGRCYRDGYGVDPDPAKAAALFHEAAGQRFAVAQYNVACCYRDGCGVKRDDGRALHWFHEAASQGHAAAQFEVGLCHAEGRGVDKDVSSAVEWYQAAAQGGHLAAQAALGTCYLDGDGVAPDDALAFKWLSKAAERNDPTSQHKLAQCYRDGRGVPQVNVRQTGVQVRDERLRGAAYWFRQAAALGVVEAQYEIGLCCRNGLGTPQSYTEACRWFLRAAEQGHAAAEYELGVCYLTGLGVNKNRVAAHQWFRQAASQNYDQAQFTLGLCYSCAGLGVDVDYEKAACWYQQAAELGHATAQFNLGICYFDGRGVKTDHALAVHWFRNAADQGDSDAQRFLGQCYQYGHGVQVDPAKAFRCFRRAALRNNLFSKLELGICYLEGRGVERNYKEAEKWLQQAAKQGVDAALPYLEQLKAAAKVDPSGTRLARAAQEGPMVARYASLTFARDDDFLAEGAGRQRPRPTLPRAAP
jgi:TPR repeat protein